MLKKFTSFFKKQRYPLQSFTYYIPGPPERNTSYREKQFDRDFHSFIQKGYKIVSVKTCPHSSNKQTGMWISVIVEPLNAEAAKLQLEQEQPELTPLKNFELEIDYE